jgi:hypothetical protein
MNVSTVDIADFVMPWVKVSKILIGSQPKFLMVLQISHLENFLHLEHFRMRAGIAGAGQDKLTVGKGDDVFKLSKSDYDFISAKTVLADTISWCW